MADSILDIPVPQNDWVELYAETGILAGTQLILQNKGSSDIQIFIAVSKPDVGSTDGFMLLSYTSKDSMAHEITEGNLSVWAKAATSGKVGGRLSIQGLTGTFPTLSRGILPVTQVENDGLDALSASVETSDRGSTGIGIFALDQTTNILTVPILQSRAAVTLASNPAVDQNVITLVGGHGVLVGEVIEIAQLTTQEFMQAKVVVVAVNDITLDQPINFPYQTTDIVQASSDNMLVDGSVTPQVFSILPLPNQSGDMVRIIMEIRGGTNQTMDFSKFGSDDALASGVVIRINNGDGTFKNLFNFKANGDFIGQGFDNTFLEPSTGNTITGFVARVTWGGQSKHGVVIRLEGSLLQALEIVIQDNLGATNNTLFKITAQGHELQG